MPIIDKEKSVTAYAFLATPILSSDILKERKLLAHQQYVVLHGAIEGIEQELVNVVQQYQNTQTVLENNVVRSASLIAEPLKLSQKTEKWLCQHLELNNPIEQEQKLVAAVNESNVKIKRIVLAIEYWQKTLVDYAAKKPSIDFNSMTLPLKVQAEGNSCLQQHLDIMKQINDELTTHITHFEMAVDKQTLLSGQLNANRGIVEKSVSIGHCETPCSTSPTLTATGAVTLQASPVQFARGVHSPESFNTTKM